MSSPPAAPPDSPDSPEAQESEAKESQESLAELLGGRRGALDAALPPLAFAGAWLAAGRSVAVAAAVAVVVAAAVAGWRWRRRQQLRAALLGLLLVAGAAVIALRTGRAADFFLVQIAVNAASALAWLVSIALRRPLLGLVVGGVLGQRTRWRGDPALLRAYTRASWVWVAQYVVRVAVLTPLWLAGQVVALGVAQVGLSWPLVAACLAVSWPVLRRALPPGHPGLRRPQTG